MRQAQVLIAGAWLAAVLLAGCGGPAASFSADGGCVADGRGPGIYPELEAALPGGLGQRGYTSRDSGRSCSDGALGTLKAHGITDLRFAGETWTGEGPDTVVAVFRSGPGQPALDPAWMEEFYETGARASSKTENIEITRPVHEDAGPVWRLDTLNELSFQSVVVWPANDLVHVVIVATQLEPGGATRANHDDEVRIAIHWAVVLGPGF